MKYVIWTVILFILCTILYGLYNSFKGYLLSKYNYDFYDENAVTCILISLTLGGFGIGLNSVGIPCSIFIVMMTIAVISLFIVLINNILKTAILPGLLTTILQAIFTVYIILMLAFIRHQVKDLFSESKSLK